MKNNTETQYQKQAREEKEKVCISLGLEPTKENVDKITIISYYWVY